MNRKICVVTGSRADYGLLRSLIQGIKTEHEFTLQIIATGMHLSDSFGLTYKDIENDGFKIDFKVETIQLDDSPIAISKSIGRGVIGCTNALNELRPDLVVLLGDRYEIFAAATAALISRIPIAHIHGGESTFGAFDEAFRHSITKMAHLHFVASEEYRNRVIQLGENPSNVFLVGGLGVDGIKKLQLLSEKELEESLEIKFKAKRLMVTFHPVTLENETAEHQMLELLSVLSVLQDTTIIFTMPNADIGGRKLIQMVESFVENNSNAKAFASLGQLKYLSCIAHMDGVVGNSSSGLTEVPTFKKGTINIGDRQLGRLQAGSIINCEPNRVSIHAAISRLYSAEFKSSLSVAKNPYGEGGASELILQKLREVPIEGIVKKFFHDL